MSLDQQTCERLLRAYPRSSHRFQRLATKKLTYEDELWFCPWKIMGTADPWQRSVLTDKKSNWKLCAARGSGKTAVSASKVFECSVLDGGFSLIVSASGRQAGEFYREFYKCYTRHRGKVCGGDVRKTGADFDNGGRIVCLPNNEATVRTYHGVDLLVIDEAARVPDELRGAITASISISKGRTIILSTPWGQQGWFYREWMIDEPGWSRAEVPWWQCPRHTPQFIERERRTRGDLWVAQEYECKFLPISSGSPFDLQRMAEMVDPALELLE